LAISLRVEIYESQDGSDELWGLNLSPYILMYFEHSVHPIIIIALM